MTDTTSGAEIFGRTLQVVSPALAAALAQLDERNQRINSYHLGFTDADGRPSDAPGGKMVRATLALLSAAAAGADNAVGLPGAVAVELVHNSSLLHDDIIDNDEVRRHRPSAWRVFGVAEAILAGDAALTLATAVLGEAQISQPVARLAALQALSQATTAMLAGQADDIAFETASDVSLSQVQHMVTGKTGALLAASCSIGALLAEAPAQLTDQLATLGHHIGMAFQLVDDILGIWGSPERTGKSAASDLSARKRSLPVAYAWETSGPGADRLRMYYAKTEPLTITELAAAAQAIADTGARQWAHAQAEWHTAAAEKIIDQLPTDPAVREQLHSVVALLCRRDH